MVKIPSAGELELESSISALFDDPDFMDIHRRMSPLNLFEAVGAIRSELRHSNFLAYLLSPNRPHGLGTRPLVAVLRAMLSRLPARDRPVMTLELVAGDLDDTIVYRERGNIDILLVLPSLGLVVAIENKVDAKAADGQLQRYLDYLHREYPDQRRMLVFLTPEGRDPEEGEYFAFDYAELVQCLEDLLEEGEGIPLETGILIRHYVEMVRRHIVQDEKLRSLAQTLYERHREAFDFIYDCRPEPTSLLTGLREIVLTVDGLIEDSASTNSFRFVPSTWNSHLALIKGDPSKWTRTGRGLLFECKTYSAVPGRVNVALILGPGDPQMRSRVYEKAMARPDVFSGIVKPMGHTWTTIFSRDLLTNAQAKELSFEARANNVALAWSDFQGNQLPLLIQTIVEIDAMLAVD